MFVIGLDVILKLILNEDLFFIREFIDRVFINSCINKDIKPFVLLVNGEDENPIQRYPRGRPKKGEPPRPKPVGKRVWNADKCPCSWPGCEKTFTSNTKLVIILFFQLFFKCF